MEISITTANGERINLEVDDTSDTIDLKIHGPTRQLVLLLDPNPDPDSDEDEEAVMQILVATISEKTFGLQVKETETIADVKAKIHFQGGPPLDQQRLIFEGKYLSDNWRTLAHYTVKTGSTLIMTIDPWAKLPA